MPHVLFQYILCSGWLPSVRICIWPVALLSLTGQVPVSVIFSTCTFVRVSFACLAPVFVPERGLCCEASVSSCRGNHIVLGTAGIDSIDQSCSVCIKDTLIWKMHWLSKMCKVGGRVGAVSIPGLQKRLATWQVLQAIRGHMCYWYAATDCKPWKSLWHGRKLLRGIGL